MLPLAFKASPGTAGLAQALANSQAHSGAQLVNAHWRWPIAWRLALVVTPQFAAAGDLTVTYGITIGSGDAQQTILRTVGVANGQTDSTVDNAGLQAFPACDLLVRVVALGTTDAHPIVGPGSVEIGAYAAPETEVHSTLEMLACLCRIEGAGNADQRQDGWMPPGFFPEELRYGR